MAWAPNPPAIPALFPPGWWVEPPEDEAISTPGWFAPLYANIDAPAEVGIVSSATVYVEIFAPSAVIISAPAEVLTEHLAVADLVGEGQDFLVATENDAPAIVVIHAIANVFTTDTPSGLPYTLPFALGAGVTVGFPFIFPFVFGGGGANPVSNMVAAPAEVGIVATATASAAPDAPADVSIIAFGVTASFPYDLPLTLS